MLPELGGNPEQNPEVLLLKELANSLNKRIEDLKHKIAFLENILGCTYEEFQVKKFNDPIVRALTTAIEKLQIENEKLSNALNLHAQSASVAWEQTEYYRSHPRGGPEVKW